MKTLLFATLGFIAASIVAWAGLLAWALMRLSPHDSYWDHDPGAADSFFACWLLSATAAAIAAALWSRRRRLAMGAQDRD